jgi:DNA recombination protein RmuC
MGNFSLASLSLIAAISALMGALIHFVIARANRMTERATSQERIASKDSQIQLVTAQLQTSTTRLEEREGQLLVMSQRLSSLETTNQHQEEKIKFVNELEQRFNQSFKALSLDALKSNNQSFLELAKNSLEKFQEKAKGELEKKEQAIQELVKPVRESLDKFDTKIQDLEKARVGAYEGLSQQVKTLVESQHHLRTETGNLVKALSKPLVRGRWGEIQLRRIVELAGMLAYCDFVEQVTTNGDEGKLRPDLVVRIPGGKSIIVDAKVPLAGYLEAMEAQTDELRREKMLAHVRQIRNHAAQLGKKAYYEQFQNTPEFVVMFIPGEGFFGAALDVAPDLLEDCFADRVLVATPVTLIALLKSVIVGWKHEALAENASHIRDLGKELYKRMAEMAGHLDNIGSALGKAVESYNKSVNSIELRVLPQARRFKDLEISVEKEVPRVEQVESTPRQFQSEELVQTKTTVEQ